MMTSPFFLIAAYLFGMATGWAAFAAVRRRRADDNKTSAEYAVQSSQTSEEKASSAREALGRLEAELRATRALLEQSDAETKTVSEEIAGLDAAIKRANGRLRLVTRALKGEGGES